MLSMMAGQRHRKRSVTLLMACVILSQSGVRYGVRDDEEAVGRESYLSNEFDGRAQTDFYVSSDWEFLKRLSVSPKDQFDVMTALRDLMGEEYTNKQVGPMLFVLEDKLAVSQLISAISSKFGNELQKNYGPIRQMPIVLKYQTESPEDFEALHNESKLRSNLRAKKLIIQTTKTEDTRTKAETEAAEIQNQLATYHGVDKIREAIFKQFANSMMTGEAEEFYDVIVKPTHEESGRGVSTIKSQTFEEKVEKGTSLLDWAVNSILNVFSYTSDSGPKLRKAVSPAAIMQPCYPSPKEKMGRKSWNNLLTARPLEVRVKVIWGRAYLATVWQNGDNKASALWFHRPADEWIPYHKELGEFKDKYREGTLLTDTDFKDLSQHVMSFIPKVIHQAEFLARRLHTPLLRLDFFVPPPNVLEADWPVVLNEVEVWDGVDWTLPHDAKTHAAKLQETQKVIIDRLAAGWADAKSFDAYKVFEEAGCSIPRVAPLEAYKALSCETGGEAWFEERQKAMERQILLMRNGAEESTTNQETYMQMLHKHAKGAYSNLKGRLGLKE